MATDYIPAKIADYALWIANFSAKLTATPVAFGLIASDAVAVATQATAFATAYAISSTPATRTSAAIAQTNNVRALATATLRPYAVRIASNSAVTDANKISIGVTVRSTTPTPVPAPTTAPALSLLSATFLQHQLRYVDVSTPTTKAKPFGATGMELYVAIGVASAVDPSVAPYAGTYTKSPLIKGFDAADKGKTATYFARWTTTAGPGGVAQTGPWSDPLSVIVI